MNTAATQARQLLLVSLVALSLPVVLSVGCSSDAIDPAEPRSDAGDPEPTADAAARSDAGRRSDASSEIDASPAVDASTEPDSGPDSGPPPVCEPEARRCAEGAAETCTAQGQWEAGEPCEFVCSDGVCTGSCVPDAVQCDGATPQTCNAGGTWDSADAPCEFLCAAGACTGECTPGAIRCASATAQETCDATGHWQAAACTQICSATTDRCACDVGYEGDGATCTPIDFCAPAAGGCSPNAVCAQAGTTPTCTCKLGFEGDGFSCSTASTVVDEGFEDIGQLGARGWGLVNASQPVGSTSWFQGTAVPTGPFDAYDGSPSQYLGANFNNTSGSTGTINTWAASPVITFGARTTVSFFTRSAPASTFPDRLEVRACFGAACEAPASFAEGVAGYTALIATINPTLQQGGYPAAWTQYTFETATAGLPRSGAGRIGLRYYVTAAGPLGTNSDYIGIDRFVVRTSSPAFSIGGTVSGLDGVGLELWLNGQETLAVAANGAFTFPRYLDSATPYSVRVKKQPAGSTCTVTSGQGAVASANVDTVQVACVAN